MLLSLADHVLVGILKKLPQKDLSSKTTLSTSYDDQEELQYLSNLSTYTVPVLICCCCWASHLWNII